MVKIQEAENQIITCYSVYEKRPCDSALLIPAIESHQEQLGRVPRLVAGDAAFYSAGNEKAARQKGVKRVCVPHRNTKSAERQREQKKPWFRNGQKWRTGCEGGWNGWRISAHPKCDLGSSAVCAGRRGDQRQPHQHGSGPRPQGGDNEPPA
jgi:hypothetical protein